MKTGIHSGEVINAVGQTLGAEVISAVWDEKELHGGTLGDVRLLSGNAVTESGERPFCIVRKEQGSWERPGDPLSWRREYDLYSGLPDSIFDETLRRPRLYYSEDKGECTVLWMEYIDGISGENLSTDMLSSAAYRLGRLQGRILSGSVDLKSVKCLGDEGYPEREFGQWHRQYYSREFLVSDACRMPERLKKQLRDGEITLIDGKSFEYGYLRSEACGLPEHIKRMFIDTDENISGFFDKIKRLPLVLCHRDFWSENIFYTDGGIRLIDWDTAGIGRPGEDIASLIADGMPASRFEDNLNAVLPEYIRGFGEYSDAGVPDKKLITEMIFVKFGYRILQRYIFGDEHDRRGSEDELQALLGLNTESARP